jgi:hypothetical protein
MKSLTRSLTVYAARIPERYDIFLFSLVAAIVSTLLTGFAFGINNNIYHLPILYKLYDDPIFATDTFVQSLRYFASGIWTLLEGSAAYIPPFWLFFAGLLASKTLGFAGLLACASLLGVTRRKERLFLAVLLAACVLLCGKFSYAGGGGLFLNYFTHSEIANGLGLFTLYYMARRQYAIAMGMNGLVFFTNAFIAVWNALPMALILAFHIVQDKRLNLRTCASLALGLILFAIPATPIVWGILHNPDFGAPLSFDYIAYLREFYPNHFLYDSNNGGDRLSLLLLVLTGMVSFYKLGKSALPFQLALLGYVGVYLIGIIVPSFTQSPLVLNLHLLRVGTFVHLLAALAVCTLGIRWFFHPSRYLRLPANLLILLSVVDLRGLALLLVAMGDTPALTRLSSRISKQALQRISSCLMGLSLVYAVGSAFVPWRNIYLRHEWTQEIETMGTWVQAHTQPQDVFLTPLCTKNHKGVSANLPAGKYPDLARLRTSLHRQIWVNFKDGASAMWAPSTYAPWHKRKEGVMQLNTMADALAYASENNLAYIMTYCAEPSPVAPVFRTQRLCLYQTPQNSTGAPTP